MNIIDIKDRLMTDEAFRVYSACMYKPTNERFAAEAQDLISDESVSVYGYIDGDSILGIVAVRRSESFAEILGIATAPESRGKGIGKMLTDFAYEHFGTLYAETDDNAAGFYRSCGFETEKFVRSFPDGQCVRYSCTRK